MADICDQQQVKQNITAIFDTISDGYDRAALRFFPVAVDRAAQLISAAPGQKILDVATGTGAMAVSLAQAVQPGGRIIAIDLSEGMLTKAQSNARRMSLQNIDWFNMDGERPEFRANYFDTTVCGFGLFYMPDMPGALTEWRRVTKPGGGVVFTCFADKAFQPMGELLKAHALEFGLDFNLWSVDPTRLADEDVCRTLLSQAGYSNIELRREQVGYHLSCVEEWWEVVWNSVIRASLTHLDNEQLLAFKDRHLTAVGGLGSDKGIWMDVEVMVCFGTA